jgi:hypothetical protein
MCMCVYICAYLYVNGSIRSWWFYRTHNSNADMAIGQSVDGITRGALHLGIW